MSGRRREVIEPEVRVADCAEAAYLLRHRCRLSGVALERSEERGLQSFRFRLTGQNARLCRLQWASGGEAVGLAAMAELLAEASALCDREAGGER